jgi:hypothetical protein
MQFIEALDGVGGKMLLPSSEIAEILLAGKDDSFAVVTTKGGQDYKVEPTEIDDLRNADFQTIPAPDGWRLLALRVAPLKDGSVHEKFGDGDAVELSADVLIAWKLHGDGRVEPIGAGNHADLMYRDLPDRRRDYALRRAVVSPIGEVFAVGGTNWEGVNFADEMRSITHWIGEYLDERKEARARYIK